MHAFILIHILTFSRTKEIVDTVCAALVLSCSDRDHPASRYGGMLRMLAKKLEELSDASVRTDPSSELLFDLT